MLLNTIYISSESPKVITEGFLMVDLFTYIKCKGLLLKKKLLSYRTYKKIPHTGVTEFLDQSGLYQHCHEEEKHCQNCKTLPWEHHIGCQMCQVALFKSAKKEEKKIIHYCTYCHCCHHSNFFFLFWYFFFFLSQYSWKD